MGLGTLPPLDADPFDQPSGESRTHQVYEPFSLGGIFLTGLLLSGAVVPLLLAINWRRIGYPRRAIPTLLIGYLGLPLCMIVVTIAAVALGAQLPSGENVPITDPFYLFVAIVSCTLVYGGLILWQTKPITTWYAQGTYPSFWRNGCLGYFIIGVAVFWAGVNVTVGAFTFASEQVLSRLQIPYQSDNISFSHPRDWTLADSPSACGEMPAYMECIAVLSRTDSAIVMLRITNPLLMPSSTADAAEGGWEGVASEVRSEGGALVLDQSTPTKRDGYETILLSGTHSKQWGVFKRADKVSMLVIRTLPQQLVLLTAMYAARQENAVQGVFDSLHIDPLEE